MAIIFRDGSRPALRFEGDTLDRVNGAFAGWGPEAMSVIERTARGVGRIEVEGGVIPWLGTAFLVAPRLAITAPYVSEVMMPVRGGDGDLKGSWINFAANTETETSQRIAIAAVEKVHRFWRLLFLRLAEDADADRVLPLADRPDFATIADRDIAVIGYCSFDQRNEVELQQKLFGDVYDVKRASPGRILGIDRGKVAGREEPDEPLMIRHDATTLGGSGGAPLIDIATGAVLGIHHSGMFGVENMAVCAWEAKGDPQWQHIWADGPSSDPWMDPPEPPATTVWTTPNPAAPDPWDAPRTPMPGQGDTPTTTGQVATERTRIFRFEEMLAIGRWMTNAGINSDISVATLFSGLSPEYLGRLRSDGLIFERLKLALDELNYTDLFFGDHPPLFYVLSNARARPALAPSAYVEMDLYIERIKQLPRP